MDDSIDPLCDVWRSMVKFSGDSRLKKNMCQWHFEIFEKEIWSEHNVSIILQHYNDSIEGEPE